jgi:hypothetical protein
MPTLRLEAGDLTEELLRFVTAELDDATLDQIEVERTRRASEGLASEPLTAAATLTLATTAVVAVTRLIERWLEKQRQLETLTIVAEGFTESDEAGRELAKLAASHANVSVKHELSKEPWVGGNR